MSGGGQETRATLALVATEPLEMLLDFLEPAHVAIGSIQVFWMLRPLNIYLDDCSTLFSVLQLNTDTDSFVHGKQT